MPFQWTTNTPDTQARPTHRRHAVPMERRIYYLSEQDYVLSRGTDVRTTLDKALVLELIILYEWNPRLYLRTNHSTLCVPFARPVRDILI